MEKLKEANAGEPITPIIWTSDMTVRGRQYLNPEDYTIHIWSECKYKFPFAKCNDLNAKEYKG